MTQYFSFNIKVRFTKKNRYFFFSILVSLSKLKFGKFSREKLLRFYFGLGLKFALKLIFCDISWSQSIILENRDIFSKNLLNYPELDDI
ncbi:hypothetical protein BpHYR1_024250 [Brachionus plicatilis]|uniref:Uncharacterized protein n=1 Tax=Brachionus plicatilis TaxID=10195 RepID=A0A3M7RUD3_BRAPC|nr:hypothetical protein BpHYR1_024250 [Brachionus plicatilis]